MSSGGIGWRAGDWTPAVEPTRQALDAVTGDVPTALVARDYHSLWVNSAALAHANGSLAVPGRSGDGSRGGSRRLSSHHRRKVIDGHLPAIDQQPEVRGAQARQPLDPRHGIVGPHVERHVGAEHHVVGADHADEMLADGIVVNQAVDVNPRQVLLGRAGAVLARLLADGVAVAPAPEKRAEGATAVGEVDV